jgi:serine/threonine protein kinase/tetratricopeptide (TPR) repeat protein
MPPDKLWQARRGQVLLNRFELSRPLGQGGMGEVWCARDRELGLNVALKLLHPELATAAAQVEFLRNECRLARSLNHPHIVQVYDFHQEGDTVFISMAWVDGPSFDRWCLETERPWIDRLPPLLPAARALDYVHGKGLVHRDVKAGNILVDRENCPHLTDFGIAAVQQLDPNPATRYSGGSQYCMSPQQRAGRPPNPSDDIYSFGVLLLETLEPSTIGDSPKPEAHSEALRHSLRERTGAPTELVEMLTRMLAHRREERPRDMATVADLLGQVLTHHDRRTIPPADDSPPKQTAASEATATIISPQPFAVPDTQRSGAMRSGWRAPVFLGILGLLLLTGGGWLIHYLARNPWVPEPAIVTIPEKTAPAPSLSAPPPPTAQPAGDKSTAEQALANWRQALADLEAIGASEWGSKAFAAISVAADAGDAAFLAADFTTAAEYYAAATMDARQLQAQAPEALKQLLVEGQTALEAGDGARSSANFALALKIDPANATARQGLARAAKVAEVVALMQSGEAHEAAGRLALALADYEAALALDPAWPPAQAAVPRIGDQIAFDQFQDHMSKGFMALQRKAFGEARREINKALAFKPNAPEALDAIIQIDTAAREDRIVRLGKQARTAETDEAWDQALNYYRQLLGIDPAIRFATQGAARAEERLRLEKRVAYYMTHPDDLGRDAYLAKAEDLLNELRRISPQGARLQSQIATLDRMVQNARTPVVVTFKSDQQTVVTVYRIGRLGQFASRQLELRPGTYTIAGVRDGYKDVRRTLRIRPGQGPTQVVVQCTEKI